MSTAIERGLTSLQQSNYATLAVLTAVGYDYVLTFSDEVKYIWSRRWTWVSTLFVFVRYLGLLNLIGMLNATRIGLLEHVLFWEVVFYLALQRREIIYTIDVWTYDIFLGAADFVMMLRIWAMYNRSKLIFGVLIILFFLEIIPSVICAVIDSDPKNLSVPTFRMLDLSYCQVLAAPVWTNETVAFQISHGATMCILAVFQFVRQAVQMHDATKYWHFNQYMKLLVRQGIVYFFVIFLFNLMVLLAASGKFPERGWQMILSLILEYVPIFTLTPRFILSIRELYAHDVERRRGEGIDTGFGLPIFSCDTSGTDIVFADVERSGRSEGFELEEVGTTRAV